MTQDKLIYAEKLEEEIIVLEAECGQLTSWWDKQFGPIKIMKLKKKPCVTTYRGFYCTQPVDIIGSVILLAPDEIKVIRDFKAYKLDLLRAELKNL